MFHILVLEPAEIFLPEFKLNSDYKAKIQENGTVKVGCVEVPFELLDEIYHAALKEN